MGDEVLEGYAAPLQHVFDHYAEDEVKFVPVHILCAISGMLALDSRVLCILCWVLASRVN
jgi:hypothetical protein